MPKRGRYRSPDQLALTPKYTRREVATGNANSPHPSLPDIKHRQTPRSLGWPPDFPTLELYSFVIIKGEEPYLKLQSRMTITPDTPEIVYLDPRYTFFRYQTAAASNSVYRKHDKLYTCQFPGGCVGKQTTFTRHADLERHYINVHASTSQDSTYACDYGSCQRSNDPFRRKDHYRDHLRDFHKEDLGAAYGQKTAIDIAKWFERQKIWLAERRVQPHWWRCPKCLLRVHVAKDGWVCRICKVKCEGDRRTAREKLQEDPNAQHSDSKSSHRPYCTICYNTTWVEVTKDPLRWIACPNCQNAIESEG